MINFDHNATTPPDPAVVAAMVAFLERDDAQGNASSVHRYGQRARACVEQARRQVAASVHCRPREVTFTSGGTEANNLAIAGIARALRAADRPSGVLTSVVEHPSVLDAVRALAGEFEVHWLEPGRDGRVAPAQVAARVRELPGVGLVSLSVANHELGNQTAPRAWVDALRAARPEICCHADAVQALGKMELDFTATGLDAMSLSAHKAWGPKGVGALVVAEGARVQPMLAGGAQERGVRPGTENMAGIVGFGAASELAAQRWAGVAEQVRPLRACLAEALGAIAGVQLHGDATAAASNTVLASFDGCPGEVLMMALDLAGICVSTGAACSAGTIEGSKVLSALGFSDSIAGGALRFSLGPSNGAQDIDALKQVLPEIVRRARQEARP